MSEVQQHGATSLETVWRLRKWQIKDGRDEPEMHTK